METAHPRISPALKEALELFNKSLEKAVATVESEKLDQAYIKVK
jgi:hypothetical protein